jgi:Alpha galactosidase A
MSCQSTITPAATIPRPYEPQPAGQRRHQPDTVVHTLVLSACSGIVHVLRVHPQVGNGKLTLSEQRAHFALWALLKAPLLIGTDLRSASAGEESCCHGAVGEDFIKASQRQLRTNLIHQDVRCHKDLQTGHEN